MSPLVPIVFAAITSIARGPVARDRAWLEAIAIDIATVADSHSESPFAGDETRAGLALALVAIAKHESEFDPKVDRCERRGDTGRSISLFQLMRGPNWAGNSDKTICSNRRLAAKLAANLLVRPTLKHPHATPQMLANAYASGSPGKHTRAAREICVLWEKLGTDAGLNATCEARTRLGAPRTLRLAKAGSTGAAAWSCAGACAMRGPRRHDLHYAR